MPQKVLNTALHKAVHGRWRVMEGVLAINKPSGISSAQVIRDLQSHFNPSAHFQPWLERERSKRDLESKNQHRRRSKAKQHLQVKIGHGGTLDPAATGVLVCGIGKATKALSSFISCTKSYEAVVLFGAATDTYDAEGKVVSKRPFEHINRGMVEEALDRFRGSIMQTPSIFSALSVNGKRLYEYAREGKEVPGGIQERPVEVMSLELSEWLEGGQHAYQYPEEAPQEAKQIAQTLLSAKEPRQSHDTQNATSGDEKTLDSHAREKRKRDLDETDVEFDSSQPPKVARVDATAPDIDHEEPQQPDADSASPVCNKAMASQTGQALENDAEASSSLPPAAKVKITCSSGFYVRSFCHDLGQAVGSHALMAHLVRTRQGDFKLGDNTFEYDDLAKGEQVWAPQVERMLNDWNAKHE